MSPHERALATAGALVGRRVRIHHPAWRDANGYVYSAHLLHDLCGVVLPPGGAEVYTVGVDAIVDVALDDGRVRYVWTDYLRRLPAERQEVPYAR